MKILRITDDQFNALHEIINYLRESEDKDYENNSSDNHIYHSIRKVNEFIHPEI